jgi:hypothetical protein
MPLARWRSYRNCIQQKRKALHMLTLSGVVRPSHVELRYTIPLLKVGTVHRSACAIPLDAARQTAPLQESAAAMRTRGEHLLQWLRQTGGLSRRLLNPWTGTAEG